MNGVGWQCVALAFAFAFALGLGCDRAPLPKPAAPPALAPAAEVPQQERFPAVETFSDIKTILDRGTLRVGIYGHNEPFVIRTPDGQIVGGLDVELVSGLARHLGVRAEFDLTCVHYADLFRKLHKGEIDVAVGGLSHTFARAQYVHFSGTYVRLNQSLIMRRSELARRHIEENPFAYLETATNAVGVLAGSSFYEYARHHFSNAIVRECSDWQEALQALGRDEVLAVLDDNNTVALLARKHPEIALDVTVYILKNMRDNIAVAISPVNPHLESCINLYLELHDLDLDLNDLMQRYPAVYRCE